MKRPDRIPPEMVEYVEFLEGCLNGADELIVEMILTSKIFGNDLRAYRTGEGEIKYIGKSDKTKKFEHVMVLFDKFDKIKALSQHFKGTSKPDETISNRIKIKPGGNIYEHVLEEVKNGRTRVRDL